MENHTYKVSVTWLHDREGWGEGPGIREAVKFSAPPDFGGRPGLWSPESLLVLAANSCFTSTLLHLAESSGLALAGYRAEAKGQVERVQGQGYRFTEIVLQPEVILADADQTELAQKLLALAQRLCIVASSLRIPVRVEAGVEVATPAPNG
ncbi:MAG: OsmC family protein [Terriglobia bacterium]